MHITEPSDPLPWIVPGGLPTNEPGGASPQSVGREPGGLPTNITHDGQGGLDDPTGYPADAAYAGAASFTLVRLVARPRSDARPPEWLDRLYLNNSGRLATSAWQIHPFFPFGTNGYAAVPALASASKPLSPTLVRLDAARRRVERVTPLPIPGRLAPPVRLAATSSTPAVRLGVGAELTVELQTPPPAHAHLVAFAAGGADASGGLAQPAAGLGGLRVRLHLSAPASLYFVAVVDGDPRMGHPRSISNVLALRLG